jgi:hypothetical protein
MAKESRIIDCERAMFNFFGEFQAVWQENKWLKVEWSDGSDRRTSMPQKALVHIWLRTYAAFLLKKPTKEVIEEEVELMKKHAKHEFYEETGESFAVARIIDPWHPDKERMVLTSIAKWDPGQCYMFMNWLQNKAGQQGLLLESKGEYANNKKKEIS